MVHDVPAQGGVGRDARTPCFTVQHLPGKARRERHLHIARGQFEQRSSKGAAHVHILVQAAGKIRGEEQQIRTKIGCKGVRRSGQNANA